MNDNNNNADTKNPPFRGLGGLNLGGRGVKALFIDRDGTLVIEPPLDYQLDSLEKLEFYPGVFRNMYFITKNLDYELVMVTNQDGLGTASFPEETFWPVQNKMLKVFENEGIKFDAIHIDPSLPQEKSPSRKPGRKSSHTPVAPRTRMGCCRPSQ